MVRVPDHENYFVIKEYIIFRSVCAVVGHLSDRMLSPHIRDAWAASTQLRTADVEACRVTSRARCLTDKLDARRGEDARGTRAYRNRRAQGDCWPSEAVCA